NPGRLKYANYLSVGTNALLRESEYLLHADRVLFHTGDFTNAGYLSGAVAHAAALHDNRDRSGYLLPDGFFRQVHIGHCDHRLQPGDRVSRGVRVNRSHGALVARIHGLQHVEGLLAAHFANDDSVGAHAEAIDQQLPLPNCALTLDIRGARFQTDDVLLSQIQFGSVFDGDQPLVVGDEMRQDI